VAGSNLVYLFVAYAIIWVVLFGYIFFLTQQVSDLRGQLDALRRGRSREGAGRPEPGARS
jgi:CcmD family protein